jgi:membrane protease subunit HflK
VFHPELGAEIDSDDLDPANRSLAEALSISFNVLRVVMIALIVWWLLMSGSTNVEEGYVGVRLYFGQVYGEEGKQVLDPGGPHWGLPDPLGRFIQVPTRPQTVVLDEAFWFHNPNVDRLEEVSLDLQADQVQQDLTPGQDGSLITGDKNIVHGQWSIEYRVEKTRAVDFIRNVGLWDAEEDGDGEGEIIYNTMHRSNEFVRNIAEQVIVGEVSRLTVDSFVLGEIDKGRIHLGIQRVLDENESGLTVTQVLVDDFTAPLKTRAAFKAVSEAQSDQAQQVEIARTTASKTLNEVAGSGYGPLLEAINNYELVRSMHDKDSPKAKAADAAINALLAEDKVEGSIALVISEAVAYRSRAKEDIRAEAETFSTLLPLYLESPTIVMDRGWQDAFQQIMSGDVEVFYMSSDPHRGGATPRRARLIAFKASE